MRTGQSGHSTLAVGDRVRLKTGRHQGRTGKVVPPLNGHQAYWVHLDMLDPNDTPPCTLVQPDDVELLGEPPAPDTGKMDWEELMKLAEETRRQQKLAKKRKRG